MTAYECCGSGMTSVDLGDAAFWMCEACGVWRHIYRREENARRQATERVAPAFVARFLAQRDTAGEIR